jgi:hypothetical protein
MMMTGCRPVFYFASGQTYAADTDEATETVWHAAGYTPDRGHSIRGAFDLDEVDFAPRPHSRGDVFVVGRMARPDMDKWSSNTWPIYSAIQYANKRALMLGMDDRTHAKLGAPPIFADCLKPMAIPVRQFLSTLHCLLPINGGACENWLRAGLEAMAAGVPIVAQNDWGWHEMIEHGVTGFLGSNDCELAHCRSYKDPTCCSQTRRRHESMPKNAPYWMPPTAARCSATASGMRS